MITYPPGKLHLNKQEPSLRNTLRVAAVLTVILSLSLLASVTVQATLPFLAEMRIQSAVNALNQDRLSAQRQQAQSELENSGERAVPALIVALRSENAVTRQNAADILGYIASPQALGALSYGLINDPAPQVRQNAAWALGEIQDLSTLDALRRAAVLDKSRVVRLAAVDSIARIRTRLALAASVNEQYLSAFVTVPGNSMIAYLAVRRDLTWTYDGGKTWHTLSKSLPSLVTTLAVSSQEPQVLYANAYALGLFKSTDGGVTWSAINTGLGIMPGAQFSVTAIAMDAMNPQRLFITTGVWIGTRKVEFFPLSVMHSIDGGATWRTYHKGTNVHPITQLAIKGTHLYALAGDQVLIY